MKPGPPSTSKPSALVPCHCAFSEGFLLCPSLAFLSSPVRSCGAQDQCSGCQPLAAVQNHQGPAAPQIRSRGRLWRGAAASEMTGLAALHLEVRHDSLGLCSYAVTLTACLTNACAMQACPAVHCVCDTLRLPLRQVLADVVAHLPLCEAVQLQRVSR